MHTLDLARWQFAATTIYHFLFVPLTIGLALLVAGMQTAWVRTDNPTYLRMTRFWGKLLLINFAIGVVTGIVQEFQFGMAWSGYSRFVGDIFGAPLAIEGLVAFFLESTFLGLWIFGWDRLPKKVHLATIWAAAIGSMSSAYFILAANSWMQHPVGYVVNHQLNRAELTSITAVLTNSTAVFAFFHTVVGALATAASVLVGISIWHMWRERRVNRGPESYDVFKKSAKLGLVTMLIASSCTVIIGHFDAQLMTRQQPMKMAAAEALWNTKSGAPLSLLTVAPFAKKPAGPSMEVSIPYLASFLATNDPHGTVKGINQIQAAEVAKYGPGEYYPIIGLTYWTFRLMMGMGMVMIFVSALGLIGWKRKIWERSWFAVLAVLGTVAGFSAHIFGWMFTEVGRQPWIVYGLQKTSGAVSHLAASTVLFSLLVFVLLYGALAIVEFKLFMHYTKRGPEIDHKDRDGESQLVLTY